MGCRGAPGFCIFGVPLITGVILAVGMMWSYVCLSVYFVVFKYFLFFGFLFQGFICIFNLHHVAHLSRILSCVQYDSCLKVCDIVCVFLFSELMASASELFILFAGSFVGLRMSAI